jgi:hypothetical protein
MDSDTTRMRNGKPSYSATRKPARAEEIIAFIERRAC